MARRILVPGVGAAFITVLVAGTAWSGPAADVTHPDRSSRVAVPPGASPSGTMLADRSDVLRLRASGWDQRMPSGAHLIGAMLGGVVLALVATSERVASRRARRSVPLAMAALGARSPPLQPS